MEKGRLATCITVFAYLWYVSKRCVLSNTILITIQNIYQIYDLFMERALDPIYRI